MLVLTRKPLQSIDIGDDIKITVVRTTGGNVAIGIEAPKHIEIMRSELKARKRKNKEVKKS